jgi:hypothetical protein
MRFGRFSYVFEACQFQQVADMQLNIQEQVRPGRLFVEGLAGCAVCLHS